MTRNFVSIDSSTTSLAFAHFEGDRLMKFGILKFSGNGIYDKIKDISSKTESLFESIDTEHIVIESTFFSKNPKVTTDLAMAQGALLGAATIKGVRFIAGVPPATWQRAIGNPPLTKDEKEWIKELTPGKSTSWYANAGRAFRKERTINFVNKSYTINVADDNIADAIGIGTFAYENWEKLHWD